MIARHEAVVGCSVRRAPRSGSSARWRRTTRGCWGSSTISGPLAGRRVLDLGCGKGRFARTSERRGAPGGRAGSVGGDARRGERTWIASGRRRGGCRSARRASTAVMAVEVFEHLAPRVARSGLRRGPPRAPAGRDFRDRRQERLLVERPAALAAERGREVDRRAPRVCGCIRRASRCASAGSVRASCSRRLGRWFSEVRVVHLLSRAEEGRFPFQYVPGTRLFVLWAARAPGGSA